MHSVVPYTIPLRSGEEFSGAVPLKQIRASLKRRGKYYLY